MRYDIAIIGGGPAGLSAALILGRARWRVLLCDAGPDNARNAAAEHLHGFVTQDGISPRAMRQTARDQLRPYPNVEVRDAWVTAIDGDLDAFRLTVNNEELTARRILACVGMQDLMPELPGFADLWGHAIFTCPYCHGWEVRDQAFACLLDDLSFAPWARFLRQWSRDLVVLTHGKPLTDPQRAYLQSEGIRWDERRLKALLTDDATTLKAIAFEEGEPLPRQILFARPEQRQTPLIASLGLELTPGGYVKATPFGDTSRPGISAAGDLTTLLQGALVAASAGAMAAYTLSHNLALEGFPPDVFPPLHIPH